MRIFIDTNIILDYLLYRENATEAYLIIKNSEIKTFNSFISALTIPNIVHILRKETTPEKTASLINYLSIVFESVVLDKEILYEASLLKWKDYEDAIQYLSAKAVKADLILSNNKKDFTQSDIPVLTCKEFLEKYLNLN